MPNQAYSVVVGIVLKFVVDLLVQAKWFHFVTPEQKNRILSLVGVLSAMFGVATALLSGSPTDGAVQILTQSLLDSISTFSGAIATHEVVKKL